MKFIAGLDGGGTKTKCVITDEKLKLLAEAEAGPSTFLLIGIEKVSETILNLLIQTTNSIGIKPSDLDAIVLGSTGAGRESEANNMRSGFLEYCESKNIKVNNFTVVSDASIALEGAFAGKPGSILIAGTGSIMFGKDANGKLHRVGGFGRFIGDEGSAYTIGRKGLTAAAKYWDNRGEKTSLCKLLSDEFKFTSKEQLITEIYQNNFNLASFAPFVVKAAEDGDKVSTDILKFESAELLKHVSAMHSLLELEQMNLSFIGGVISGNTYFTEILKNEIKNSGLNIKLMSPEYPPVIGAVITALNKPEGYSN